MAFHPDIAVHQLEIFLHDVQAESDAVKITGMSFMYLLEGTEDSIHIVGLDADAGVSYGKFNAVEVPNVSNPQIDAPTRGKLKSIADQVLHNFLQLGRIRDNRRKILFDFPGNLQSIASVECFNLALRLGDDFIDVDGR